MYEADESSEFACVTQSSETTVASSPETRRSVDTLILDPLDWSWEFEATTVCFLDGLFLSKA